MEDNAISEEKAVETGFEIEPYTGPDIIVGNGDTFRPVGYIELQFHFQKVQAAKSWKLRFLIITNPPFDVACKLLCSFKRCTGLSHEVLPVRDDKTVVNPTPQKVEITWHQYQTGGTPWAVLIKLLTTIRIHANKYH